MKLKTSNEIIDISTLQRIGRGRTYTTYKLDEERVIKLALGTPQQINPGKVLEALEGIPLIPKVYDYEENGDWYIMQYINGYKFSRILKFGERHKLKGIPYDYEKFEREVTMFFEQCYQRKWNPRDTHTGNIMLDLKGNVWIVDVDHFRNRLFKARFTYDDKRYVDILQKGERLADLKRLAESGYKRRYKK